MRANRPTTVAVIALALGLLAGEANCSASGSDLDFTWIAGSGTWETPADWTTNFYGYFDTNSHTSTCRPTNYIDEVKSNLTVCAGGGTGSYPGGGFSPAFESAYFTNAGTYTITLSGSLTTSSNIFANASNTAATVTLDVNGNQLEGYDAFTIAAQGASTTTVLLVTSVAGGELLLHGGLGIGQNGFGTLVVNSGTVANGTGSANLGTGIGGRGVLVVSGPSTWLWPNSQISIGNDPRQDPAGSMLVISNGAHVLCSSSFRLGSSAGKGGSSNNLCVVNPGSILACDTGPISIGLRSTGVTNSDGGTLCYNNIAIIRSGGLWSCGITSLRSFIIGDAAFFGPVGTQSATASPPASCTGNILRIEAGGVVTGISTLYVGPTNGLELLGGRLETQVISNWGRMTAYGTYRGEYRGYPGGVLETRNSLGALVISNGLWLVTNSVLEVELGTNYQPTEVFFNRATNRLEVTGATLNLLDSGGFDVTGVYTLISYSTNGYPVWGGTNAWGFTNFTGFVIGRTPNANHTYTIDTNTLGEIKLLIGDLPTNSWIDSGNGKWEEATKWSELVAPAVDQAAILITNANTKTVTIDAVTTNSPATLTINNLTVFAPPGFTNTLAFDKAGVLSNPLLVLNSVTVGSGGVISITNSSLQVDAVGGVSGIDGVVVGVSGAGRQLNISGGAVSDIWGILGHNFESTSNTVLVSGPGSVWSNGTWVYIGWAGTDNQLIIDNGGQVNDRNGYLGYSSSSTNNVALVNGAGSVWSNQSLLYIGLGGAGSSLMVSNGGKIVSNSGTLGQGSSSRGNAVLVTDTGSVWSNGSFLWLGNSGSGNRLVIRNGGQVINRTSGFIGYSSISSNNSALVSGAGSVWRMGANLYVGFGGPTNWLTVGTDGSVIASNVYIGSGADSVGNQVFVNGGALFATNAPGNGVLDVRPGTLSFNGGTVTVDELLANSVSFNNGVLNTKATFVTNAAVFVVGDGASPANFHLLGGTHTFDSGLRIRSGASLTGCGTISGNMVVDPGGTVQADCGSALNFGGTVTNNGNLTAVNGTAINFYGPVVNNGTIDGTGGSVRFYSTLQNNNAVKGAANSWIDGSGKWETAADWWLGTAPSGNDAANLITNAGNKTVTIDATTSGGSPGTMTIQNLSLAGVGSATNTLALSNAGLATPLHVLYQVDLSNRSAVVINNSALQVDAILSVGTSSGSDNQLVITNGGQLVSSLASVGAPFGFTNTVVVTGTNSLWFSGNAIQLGNGGSADSLTVSDAGAVVATNAGHTARVTVDGATVVLGDGVFKYDNLVITNGGAVQYIQTYQVENANVTIDSGSMEAGSNFIVAGTANSTATVAVVGGTLVATNSPVSIGNNGTTTGDGGRGLMIVSNTGTLLASTILVGNSSLSNQSDLIVADGGTIRCPNGTNCLLEVSSLGTEVLENGTFNYDGSTAKYGLTAPGDHYQGGGETDFGDLYVGYTDAGTITVASGILHLSSRLIVGQYGSPAAVTGTVWMAGGQMTVEGYSLIGNSGVGQMIISNGLVTAADVIVGNSGNPGTLTLAGGTLTANGIVLPNPSSRLIFSGGWLNTKAITNANGQSLLVGNANASATLKLLSGITVLDNGLTMSAKTTLTGSGTVHGDVTNYGLIMPGDGTLTFVDTVINYGLIITNSAIQFRNGLVNHGTVLDAAKDDDGDGMDNLSEILAGTDPLNSASVFRIVRIARDGDGMSITWTAVGGKRYVVQSSPGTNGSYTNIFTDISPTIPMAGTGEFTTGYYEFGGATNTPARYYRVRVIP